MNIPKYLVKELRIYITDRSVDLPEKNDAGPLKGTFNAENDQQKNTENNGLYCFFVQCVLPTKPIVRYDYDFRERDGNRSHSDSRPNNW